MYFEEKYLTFFHMLTVFKLNYFRFLSEQSFFLFSFFNKVKKENEKISPNNRSHRKLYIIISLVVIEIENS